MLTQSHLSQVIFEQCLHAYLCSLLYFFLIYFLPVSGLPVHSLEVPAALGAAVAPSTPFASSHVVTGYTETFWELPPGYSSPAFCSQ